VETVVSKYDTVSILGGAFPTWGIGWLSQRFNARHRMWGHLFGGRYKAIPVQEGSALTRLIHYVHLNPVRASLVKLEEGIESYPWGSLEDDMKPKRSRRSWVAVDRGLEHMELPDTAAGRPQASAACGGTSERIPRGANP
jgi:putative transposase